MTDEELLDAFRLGSEPAFGELIQRHAGMVYRVCRVLLRDDAAEDATQAVFILLAKKKPALTRPGTVAGWLYRTAQWTSRVASREQQRRGRHEQEAAQRRGADAGEPTWDEARSLLHAAMDELPAAQREAIVLRYFLDKSEEEASQVLGCGRGTLSSRLSRGIEALRVSLSRRGWEVASPCVAGVLLKYGAAEMVPATLAASVRVACVQQAASKLAVALAQATSKAMFYAKLKVAALVLVLAGAASTAVVTARRATAEDTGAAPPATPPPVVRADAPPPSVAEPLPAAQASPIPLRKPALGLLFTFTNYKNFQFNSCKEGVRVRAVMPGETGDKLGVRVNDVIAAINEKPVTLFHSIYEHASAIPVGDEVRLKVLRDGKEVVLKGKMDGPYLTDDDLPVPWPKFRDSNPLRFAFYAGSVPHKYEAVFDRDENSRAVLCYRSTEDPGNGFGTWMTSGPSMLRLDQLRGKRVRFSASVRTKDVARSCGLWMRIDATLEHTDCYQMPGFDNMNSRPITGTTDWQSYNVVLDVPETAKNVCFGVLIAGPGTLWLKDAMLEEVDQKVPVTNMKEACDPANKAAKEAWDEFQAGAGREDETPPPPPKTDF